MKKGDRLVIVGCSGAGGPAAMLAKKLMPEIDVTVIPKEKKVHCAVNPAPCRGRSGRA